MFKCPGSETLYEVLANVIDNLPEEVVFKEWVHTDRADLITRLLPKDQFLNHLVEEMENSKHIILFQKFSPAILNNLKVTSKTVHV